MREGGGGREGGREGGEKEERVLHEPVQNREKLIHVPVNQFVLNIYIE